MKLLKTVVNRMRLASLRTGVALITGGFAAAVLAVAPPALASERMVFTGGGRGLTAETAIQSATWDAQTSAESMGFYDCTPVGEPRLFPGIHPILGPVVFAEVDVSCVK